MAKQYALSLQIPVIPDQVDAITDALNQVGNPSESSKLFPLQNLTTVHFARWLVVPAGTTRGGEQLPASVIYSANLDVTPDQHMKEIAESLGDGLDEILKHCTGYPPEGQRTAESRLKYLRQYMIKTPAFYVGAPNRTVEQIENEASLHRAVRDFVKANKGAWKSSREAFDAIKEFLANDPQWDWARKHYALPKKAWLKLIPLGLFVLLISPLLLLTAILIQILYETRDKPYGLDVNQVPLDHMQKMKSQEDIIYQNQLSQVFETKTGLRRMALHFFLWFTNLLAAWWAVGGQLLGTPTIHFARWVLIDGGRRFVFFSNFDGSFDEYLGDFVDNSGWGLNAIYGAAVGYPKTFLIFGEGAYKIGEFMGWGRYTQVQTQAFYSAYPWYGLQQIVDRSKLRVELFNSSHLSEEEIKASLRRI